MESNNHHQCSAASHSEQDQNLEASSYAMQIAAYEESLRNPSGSSQPNASREPHSMHTSDEASSYSMQIQAYEESLRYVSGSSQYNVGREPHFMRTNDESRHSSDGFAHAYLSALSGSGIDQSRGLSFYNELDLPASPPKRPRPGFATLHPVPTRQVTYEHTPVRFDDQYLSSQQTGTQVHCAQRMATRLRELRDTDLRNGNFIAEMMADMNGLRPPIMTSNEDHMASYQPPTDRYMDFAPTSFEMPSIDEDALPDPSTGTPHSIEQDSSVGQPYEEGIVAEPKSLCDNDASAAVHGGGKKGKKGKRGKRGKRGKKSMKVVTGD